MTVYTVGSGGGWKAEIATLSCPAGTSSSHPDATEACADLTNVRGDLGDIQEAPQKCPSAYKAVKGRAVGVWAGQPVAWERIFANRCELNGTTGGAVFNF
ncbi:SSI family serine proteinase inhibitor [Actinomadura fulvescens]